MTELLPQSLPGASVWEQDMYAHLLEHAAKESDLLQAYRDSAAESRSAAFSYVVDLILDDEIRHHQRFKELAEAIRADSELQYDDPTIPRFDWHKADIPTITALTRNLITQERADARELKRLRKELRDVEDTTLWALLVRLMEADTAKHIEILKFVQKHARAEF